MFGSTRTKQRRAGHRAFPHADGMDAPLSVAVSYTNHMQSDATCNVFLFPSHAIGMQPLFLLHHLRSFVLKPADDGNLSLNRSEANFLKKKGTVPMASELHDAAVVEHGLNTTWRSSSGRSGAHDFMAQSNTSQLSAPWTPFTSQGEGKAKP